MHMYVLIYHPSLCVYTWLYKGMFFSAQQIATPLCIYIHVYT